MGRGVIYYIFRRPRFCCCLPVRICVIILSFLGIILSGLLSIVSWFEVSRGNALTSKQHSSFIGGAIVAMLLLLISIFGLIGAIVRKLTLATIYAVGLYTHFLINLIVAIYLLSVILHTTHTDSVTLCQSVLSNQQSKNECDSIFDSIRGLYAGIASFVLTVELYAAIVATRYVYQLRREKREARMPNRLRPQSDLRRLMPGIMRYTDASGATVYSSHSYRPMKGHSHEASAYSLAEFDFEDGFGDLRSGGLHDIVNFEARGSEDEDEEDNGHGHEDRRTAGLHVMENHEARTSRASSTTMVNRNAPEGALSTE